MIGEVISNYRILESVGSGGMGVVCRAEDVHLHRTVALKFLPDDLVRDPIFVARFRREATAASALSHPNICTIYGFYEDEGRPFIAMEFLSGSTLAQRIAGCPMGIKTIVSLAIDVAAGLDAAHSKGIIHRDIKPSNLFVVDAVHAKILDFGLAKFSSKKEGRAGLSRNGFNALAKEPLTDSGRLLGTIGYMSPEQARGEELDERTDLFSFGVVLYEMATGKSPFVRETPALTFDAILNQELAPPSGANPFLPPQLEQIIQKAIEKDRNLRYQHAREILADLRALKADLGDSDATNRLPLTSITSIRQSSAAAAGAATATSLATSPKTLAYPPTTVDVPRLSSRVPRPTHWSRFAIALITCLILLAGVGAYLWRSVHKTAQASGASIAVLPFVDLSPEQGEDYFSDGLTEEIINDLAKVPGIKVVARSSAFQFKGKNEDLRAIGQKLGVATVLEGTVRRDGNHLRVHADLTNTRDGFELWSESYDRKIDDAFTVQDEIARATTRALKIKLLAGKNEIQGNSRPASAAAYQAYLQARYFNGRGQGKEDLERALAFSNQAIARDPKYAPAWAERSSILSTMGMVAAMDISDAYRGARRDAEQAIALDPSLSDGYIALAKQQMVDDRDWEGADASLKKAAELEPGSVRLLTERAQLLRTLGRLDESIDLAKRAAELDPLRARTAIFIANLLYYAGRYDEAEAALREGLQLNPQAPAAHAIRGKMLVFQGRPQQALPEIELEPSDWYKETGLSIAYYALGRANDSQSELEQLIATHKSDCAYQIAEVYAFRGDADHAFEWLNRAYDQRDPGLNDLKIDPALKGLRKDQRFKDLLKKTRLA